LELPFFDIKKNHAIVAWFWSGLAMSGNVILSEAKNLKGRKSKRGMRN